jgi:hypothetical protein
LPSGRRFRRKKWCSRPSFLISKVTHPDGISEGIAKVKSAAITSTTLEMDGEALSACEARSSEDAPSCGWQAPRVTKRTMPRAARRRESIMDSSSKVRMTGLEFPATMFGGQAKPGKAKTARDPPGTPVER